MAQIIQHFKYIGLLSAKKLGRIYLPKEAAHKSLRGQHIIISNCRQFIINRINRLKSALSHVTGVG